MCELAKRKSVKGK